MKTTVEELKAYYVKIGGQLEDVKGIDTIPDIISKITEISGGGSGGSDAIIVTFTEDAQSGLIAVTDATFEDIYSKLENGKYNEVFFRYEKNAIYVADFYEYEDVKYIFLQGEAPNFVVGEQLTTLSVLGIVWTDSDSIEMHYSVVELTPIA